MRKISLFLLVLLLGTAGCDTFLERYPKDSVTNQNFWKSERHLKIYANTFYTGGATLLIQGHGSGGYAIDGMLWDDNQSDNRAPASFNAIAAGQYTVPSSDNRWEWSFVRRVNYFLQHYREADIPEEVKNIYAGEARFFRAWAYFKKVKWFGAVPWISKPLNTDSEKLYAPRTPRKQVMDSVLIDINFAIEHLPPMEEAEPGRIHREAALALKARIALHEGTFRKYHRLGDAEPWLREAKKAAKRLIDSREFEIYSTGHPNQDYRNLFIQRDYAGNPEIIYAKKYMPGMLTHAVSAYLWYGYISGVTKSLVEAYLCMDGEPVALSDVYLGDGTIANELTNRDPRLKQTVAYPGTYMQEPFGKPVLPGMAEGPPTTTGYQLIKFYDTTEVSKRSQAVNDAPVFRYAEVLLIYAEASAELGEIGQRDLDISINRLRDRVGMPHMVLGQVPRDPNTPFPNIPPLIAEIRRERRMELAFEGFRWDDLMRWKAGELLEGPVLGMKFNPEMYPNVTVGEEIYLNEEGYISVYKRALPNGREWQDRMYYFPIPTQALSLNENLEQNPDW